MSNNKHKSESSNSTNSTKKEIHLDFKKVPFIPDDVFEVLPKSLRELCADINDRRQRDLFLISSLSVISNHLVNVKTTHADGIYTPSFFFLAIAPPASGKGILNKTIKLMDELLKWEKEQNRLRKKEYNNLSEGEKKHREPPSDKLSLIPANTSSRAFYDALEVNNGKGIIFETELDTMVNASSQEWGNFSEITRNAFHHESISINRKGVSYYIPNPDLSICMSGTFDQFRSMFKSAANGNFSRYTFYTFFPDRVWKSHRPTVKTNSLDNQLAMTSKYLLRIREKLLERDSDLFFGLIDSQWDELDSNYESELTTIKNLDLSRHLDASNARMAIIQIRMASILSLLRYFNESENILIEKNNLSVKQVDYDIAQKICVTLNRHTWLLYHWFFTDKENRKKPERYTKWYNSLPNRFQTNQAIQIGEKFEIPESTVKKWLSKHSFKKIKHGHYKK